MNEYEKQANDFLKETDTTMEVTFLYNGKHFDTDEHKRDIYEITLSNDKHTYTLKFGQSMMNTARYNNGRWEYMTDGTITGIQEGYHRVLRRGPQIGKKLKEFDLSPKARVNRTAVAPTAYDVLACITKYDPYSFSDFCLDYGYDEDSIRAEKTFRAVQEEWRNVSKLFTLEELELLQEIN